MRLAGSSTLTRSARCQPSSQSSSDPSNAVVGMVAALTTTTSIRLRALVALLQSRRAAPGSDMSAEMMVRRSGAMFATASATPSRNPP